MYARRRQKREERKRQGEGKINKKKVREEEIYKVKTHQFISKKT